MNEDLVKFSTRSEATESAVEARVSTRTCNFDDLLEMLRNDQHFAMSRWGDGEWNSVLDRRTRGVNTDGHEFSPEVGEELRRVLQKRPPYLLGLAAWERVFGSEVHDWLIAMNLHDLHWISANIWLGASVKGRLNDFIATLQARPTWIVIGPEHLARTQPKLGFAQQIVVPKNSFVSRADLLQQSLALASRLPQHSVITVSAGMTANLIVQGLYEQFGDRHTIIDTGSLWDPYAGVFSRSYMREEEFKSKFGFDKWDADVEAGS